MKVVVTVVETEVEKEVAMEVEVMGEVEVVAVTVEERDIVNLIYQIYTKDTVDLQARKYQTDHNIYIHKK